MDMLIDLHRAAMDRLTWRPSELASYLVDRGIAEQWHPFGSLAVLYREDLGGAFHEAADEKSKHAWPDSQSPLRLGSSTRSTPVVD